MHGARPAKLAAVACPNAGVMDGILASGSTDERAALKEHVRGCPACRQRMVDLAGSTATIAEAEPKPRKSRPVPLERGTAFGRYVILEHLATGGMGEVYAAWDPQLDRKVALKRMRPGASGDSQGRLLREARALARLSHPNVVSIHDVGSLDDGVYLAMEFIEGTPLNEWLSAEPRSPGAILEAFVAAGRGLLAAHAAGLVHRDFKPHNVVIGDDGRIRVLDFGLARTAEDAPSGPVQGAVAKNGSADGFTALTQDGMVLGTPGYMAPEQLRGDPLDARTDQYAFCLSLHEALYRAPAFPKRRLEEVLEDMEADRLSPPPRKSDVPARIYEVIARGLRARPSERFASMDELLRALQLPRGRASLRIAAVAAGVLVGAGLSVAGFAFGSQSSPAVCLPPAPRVDALWGPVRQEKVKAAFDHTGLANAAATYAEVSGALTAYAQAWSAGWVDACAATRVRNVQSEETWALRTVCLEQRYAEASALAEILSAADARVIATALGAVRSLPPVGRCADPAVLARLRPLREGAADHALADHLRPKIAEVRALLGAGKYAAAIERAVALEAEAKDAPRVGAHAALLLGRLHEKVGAFDDAQAALLRAHARAEVAADDVLRAHSLVSLVSVDGYRRADAEAGALWAMQARAVLARLGSPPELSGDLALAEGTVALGRGDAEEATTLIRRALTLWDDALGPGHPKRANARDLLGAALARTGALELARAEHEAALQIRLEALGADHPDLVASLENAGAVAVQQGRWHDAKSHFVRAVSLAERTLGQAHPASAQLRTNLCRAQQALKEGCSAVR